MAQTVDDFARIDDAAVVQKSIQPFRRHVRRIRISIQGIALHVCVWPQPSRLFASYSAARSIDRFGISVSLLGNASGADELPAADRSESVSKNVAGSRGVRSTSR